MKKQITLDELPDVEIENLQEGDFIHPVVDEHGNIIKYVNTSNSNIPRRTE